MLIKPVEKVLSFFCCTKKRINFCVHKKNEEDVSSSTKVTITLYGSNGMIRKWVIR